MSDAAVFLVLLSLSEPLKGAVDEDDSDEWKGALTMGELDFGVTSVEGKTWGTASVIEGDNGAI